MLGKRRSIRTVVSATVAVALLVGVSLGGGGCGCGAVPVTMVVPSSVPALSPAPAVSSIGDLAPVPAMMSLDSILVDSRLTSVVQLVEAQDSAGAGAALERLAEEPTSGADRPRWLYQAGRLYEGAGRSIDALRVFSASAAIPWALTSYASYAAARQALAAGRSEDALSLAQNVGKEAPLGSRVDLLLADIQEQKNAIVDAIPLWRHHLASSERPVRWAEISVKLAQALVAKQPAELAEREEALRLVRRVALEQPAGASGKAARSLEQAILASLPAERQAALARSSGEELVLISALLDAGRTKDAESALSELLRRPDVKGREIVCKTASLDGKIKGKRKQRDAAVVAWADAIQSCEGEQRAAALYNGGSASASAGNHSEALARFDQLEKEFPKNRLADDARLKGALEALELGDEARFSRMLARIGEDYPEGDMATEGLFRLALHRMNKGDWAGAVAPLDASRKLRPRERDYRAAGRTEYFLARAFQATGEQVRAAELYREVIREQPLSFYMIQAYARLAEGNASDAEGALTSGKVATPSAPPLELPPLDTPFMQRAVELLRQGDLDFAKAEISAAKLLGSGASPESSWLIANLYGKTGALVLAHAIPRGRVSDWLERYPEAGWRARWELAYPRPYWSVVEKEAKRSGIPTSLAYAIMREESAFDPNAVSGAPAYGLMQFTMDTAKVVGKKLNLPISEATVRLPATSIALGCRYLADLRARYPDCPAIAIPSYNAGPGATRRWIKQRPVENLDLFIERIPYEETRNYTKRVLKSYAAYLYLYEPELLSEALRLPARTQGTGVTTEGE